MRLIYQRACDLINMLDQQKQKFKDEFNKFAKERQNISGILLVFKIQLNWKIMYSNWNLRKN